MSRCPAGVPSLSSRGHSSPFMFILLLTFPRIHCSVPCEMTGYSCFHLNHLGPAYISCFVYINVEEVLYCYTAFEFFLPCPLELFIFVGLFTWICPSSIKVALGSVTYKSLSNSCDKGKEMMILVQYMAELSFTV